jgi:hypothetical protein
MTGTERIMDHEFQDGRCVKCGRSRTELLAYGHPDIQLEPGLDTGLSCNGQTTNAEIESLRAAWKKEREKWDKVFA